MEESRGALNAKGLESLKISNRDRALVLMREHDLEAQLLAIKSLLHRNRESEQALEAEIDELESKFPESEGKHWDYLQHSWIDHVHLSVFHDAAHSMSAVGMLAPFVESMFVVLFKVLSDERRHGASSDVRKATLDGHFLDPHYVFEEWKPAHRHRQGYRAVLRFDGSCAFLARRLRADVGCVVHIPQQDVSPRVRMAAGRATPI